MSYMSKSDSFKVLGMSEHTITERDDDYTEIVQIYLEMVSGDGIGDGYIITLSTNHSECPSGYCMATYEEMEVGVGSYDDCSDYAFHRCLYDDIVITTEEIYSKVNKLFTHNESNDSYYPDGDFDINFSIYS